MFCMQCGKQLPDDAKFCSACGARITAAPRTAAPTRSPSRPATPQSSTRPVTPQAPGRTAAPGRPSAPTPNPTRPAAPNPTRPAAPQTPTRSAAPAQNTSANTRNPQSGQTTQGAQKKTNPLLVILVCIAVYFIFRYIGGSFAGAPGSRTIDDTPFAAATGESFSEILPDGYSASGFNVTPSGYAAYVKEGSDGMIYLMEFGYEEDLVKEIITTVFVPTSDWGDSEIGAFLTNANATIQELQQEHLFTSGKASVVGDYEYAYVKIQMKNMDIKYNIDAAVEEELITVSADTDTLSMYQTEQMLKEDGYAKK